MSSFEQLLQESILNPKAQEFIDKAIEKHGDSGQRQHDHVFGEHDNIVIPLGNSEYQRKIDVSAIHPSITSTLAKHGYGIHDYVNNVAVRSRTLPDGSVREDRQSIGKVLAREKDGVALKHFNEDKQRKSRIDGDHEIVISRDPQKVGRMTSSRMWSGEHCTRLPGPEMVYPSRTKHISDKDIEHGGLFHHTVAEDIKHGTIIAYLVKKGDHNVEAPLGRILLKKHNAVDEVGRHLPGYRPIWRPELYHDFGHSPDGFKATMKEWSMKNYPALQGKEKAVRYTKEPDLYDDKPETETSDFIHRAKGKWKMGKSEVNFNDSNEIHDQKEGGPAKVTREALSWEREEHYQRGVPHRDGDLPQETMHEYGDTGKKVTQQVWRKKGFVHRDGDKPAMIMAKGANDDNPTFTHMKYDLRHRDSKLGPAEYSKTSSTYYTAGVEHRPASEGPSHINHRGEFRHMEVGKLARPPHGGPSSMVQKALGGNQYTWAATDNEPEVTLSNGNTKMVIQHPDGSLHRYENGVHTIVDDEGIRKEPMTSEDHATFHDYLQRTMKVPSFKPHQ